MTITITDYFRDVLHAPLANHVQSWGAISDDGNVFLRVWYDRRQHFEGRLFRQLLNPDSMDKHGYGERERHVRMIEHGIPGYMVIIHAKDIHAEERRIRHFKNGIVVPIGRVKWTDDGICWGECLPTVALHDIRRKVYV